ncbi:MAG: hypothetical protein OEU95_07435, partial [Nitrospirota bacterium]|nr:hypothetical protein [Nitrospirota bacterium]
MYGFIITILLGTGLLMLPYSTTGGIFIIDAFFTATSAVCVTGLIVKNTAADFTFFGKAVILFLIQVGGLGYMSMATFIALLAGKKIGITQRMMIKESLNIVSHEGLVKFVKGMLLFVLAAEGLGTALLYSRFAGEYNTGESFFLALFHSISAFNNAGFSLFEDNLIGYRSDVLMNLSIMSLVFFGGIGFSVVDDIYGRIRRQEKRVMLHTRLALITSGILIIAGAALIYVNEREYLFLQSGFGGAESVLSSLFASVTSRTAGFNTVDYSLLQPATLFLTIILMFIGASPGSTGGGIKTTTFSIILLHIWSTIRGRQETVAFSRRIPPDFVSRSLVILSLSVIYIT